MNCCRSTGLVFGVGQEGGLDSAFWLLVYDLKWDTILLLVTACTNYIKLLLISCLYPKELKKNQSNKTNQTQPLCKRQTQCSSRTQDTPGGHHPLPWCNTESAAARAHPAPPAQRLTACAETRKFLPSFGPDTTLHSCNPLQLAQYHLGMV